MTRKKTLTKAFHPSAIEHGALMDRKYRHVRHVYDLTRKFFLLGRDDALEAIASTDPKTILDIGCGTGRNALGLARMCQAASVDGIDVSRQMLATAEKARARVPHGGRVRLVYGNAETLESVAELGVGRYDAVLMSYSLSMIADWQSAARRAFESVSPTGIMAVVEFGEFWSLPVPVARLGTECLTRFNAPPCKGLVGFLTGLGDRAGFSIEASRGALGFNQTILLRGKAVR